MNPFEVSVVICTYATERLGDVLRAVKSAQDQTLLPVDITVAVDHNDALCQWLKTHLTGIRVVRNEGCRGLSATRNVGIRACRGSIVAFLDDDAVGDSGWLENLTSPFVDPRVAGVGGRIIPSWPDGRPPRWLSPELYWIVGCTYEGPPIASGEIRNVIGCNMAFRRSVLDQVGYFRSGLGRVSKSLGQAEETDFCLRTQRLFPNARIAYVSKAVVYHTVAQGRLTLGFLVLRSFSEGYFKALMTRFLGDSSGEVLATEKQYLRHIIISSVPAKLMQVHRISSIAQIGGILLSVAVTGVGYLVGKISLGRRWSALQE